MEENNLSHSMPTWSSRKLITSQSPASFSLEPNEKLKNNTQQACKSPNYTNDKGKDPEEGHSENIGKVDVEETGRERLKRLREEVTTEKVNIPENWGQEPKLKDWMDYTMFDAFFPHSLIVTARDALIANARKAKSPRL